MSNTNKPRRTAQETQAIVQASLNRRYWAERRFRACGMAAIVAALTFLVYLFLVIFSNGMGAFRQSELRLDIFYDPAVIDPVVAGWPHHRRDEDHAPARHHGMGEQRWP